MKIKIFTDVATADSIEAAGRSASNGDTIQFVPVNNKPLLLSRTADLTCMTVDNDGKPIAKQLHVEATGAVLYSRFLGPCLTIGAPPNQTVSTSLRGGSFVGGLVVQNAGYSRIEPEKVQGSGSACPALELRADGEAGYNFFQIPGGLSGADIGFQITLLNKDAWSNFCKVADTSFAEQVDGKNLVAAIAVRSPEGVTPTFAPGLWVFDHIDVEGVGALLDCPNSNVGFQFMNFGYSEGQIAGGVIGPKASVCLDCWQGGITGVDINDRRWNFMRRA